MSNQRQKEMLLVLLFFAFLGNGFVTPFQGVTKGDKGVLLLEYTKNNLESWALESGIQLKEYGIPLTFVIKNPSSTDLKSRIQNIRLSRIFLHGASFA